MAKRVATTPKKPAAKRKPVAKPVAVKPPVKLPGVLQLAQMAWRTLWQHRRLFIHITLLYGIFNLILVQGLSNTTDLSSLKHSLQDVLGGNANALSSSLTVFTVLISSSGNTSSAAGGAYQVFLVLMVSLALIWSLREVMNGVTIRARDAYYRGMYPLIPFMLVLLVIGLELVPLALGASIYSIVVNTGIAVLLIEKLCWGLVFVVLAALSLYLLSSSVFALYIVTLPDMTPIKALRSANSLVRHRRWLVLRRVLALPLLLLIVSGVILLPIILTITALAQWVFFLLTMFAVAAIHAYLYTLYRELLRDKN